jgi:hypothetical protein
MIAVIKTGVLYFAGVFLAGFVLGAIRTLWVAPALGARAAELVEAPIMLWVIAQVARATVRRHAGMARSGQWLATGLFALALMLVVEFTVVLRLRDLSLSGYFASRDPVSGAVYVVLLGIFAVMPVLMFRQRGGNAA